MNDQVAISALQKYRNSLPDWERVSVKVVDGTGLEPVIISG
jgi:hypothetical protein